MHNKFSDKLTPGGQTSADQPQSNQPAAKVAECGDSPHPAPGGGSLVPRSSSDATDPRVCRGAENNSSLPVSIFTGEAKRPASNSLRGNNTHQSQRTGAPPSNTAPANCIFNTIEQNASEFRLLRYGVDSLYLSYPGQLATSWEQRLEGLKRAAQSTESEERCNAQVKIGEHLFEVRDKGKGRFAFVLVDNCFHIQLSSSEASVLPLAYVQLSSELLTALSIPEAEAKLRYIINTLGRVESSAQISRVDLFVDFIASFPMNHWDSEAWVTRADNISTHVVKKRFSGWSIGLGGVMSARLYDKTLELEKSKKDYLKPLWSAAGWQEGQTVWRLEFQFKRNVLKELGVVSIDELLPNLAGLWGYATTAWLRLTVPNPDDQTQTRWPDHPLWESLAAVPWSELMPPALTRLRKERIPSDESLFINGIGGLTSFMARQGITDLGEGIGEFLAHADRFHESYQHKSGKNFKRYVLDKVCEKGRKYNTLANQSKARQKAEQERIGSEANEYRKAQDGE